MVVECQTDLDGLWYLDLRLINDEKSNQNIDVYVCYMYFVK